MDLPWVMVVIGSFLAAGYFFYSALEKRIKELESRIRHVEKQLKQAIQGIELTEPDINEELRTLLQQGKMVEAVKRTRQDFGLSLLEAKQYIDELKAGK